MTGPRNRRGWLTAAALRAHYCEVKAWVGPLGVHHHVQLSWGITDQQYIVTHTYTNEGIVRRTDTTKYDTLTEARPAFKKASAH